MSTLNLGSSPILKPMQSGNGTLTATGYIVTYNYYKKDNVVTLQISFKPNDSIAIGTNTITSDALPSYLRPVMNINSLFSATNTGSGSAYLIQFTVYNNGKIAAFNFQFMTSAWSALWATITYLVND